MEDLLPIEYPVSRLAELLQPELDRFEISQAGQGWRAWDEAADEILRGATYEDLLINMAIRYELLDLTDRPTMHGRAVLIAEVTGSGFDWLWRAVDASGRTHYAPNLAPDRDRALMDLNSHYD